MKCFLKLFSKNDQSHLDIPRPNVDIEKKTDQKILWYPKADTSKPQMKTRGKYRKGYPEGAVIHFTAGSSGVSSLDSGRNAGYCFFLIDRDGTVHQNFPLDEWGSHAGESFWEGLGKAVSQYLVGIEIACAGSLEKVGDKYKAWFHNKPEQYFSESEVRFGPKGFFHKYTEEQEKSLLDLLIWLKLNNQTVFNLELILGHEDVAPGRKNDPGHAMSMTVNALRDQVRKACGYTNQLT